MATTVQRRVPAPRRAPVPRPARPAAPPSWAARHATPLALIAIVVLYLGTRLALTWRFPPFWDETGYAEWAQAAAASSGTRFASMAEGKEPLTSWIGALFIHAGVPYMTAIRLVSLVAGAVTLTMLWLVGRRISTQVALVAMALYAGLPLFVVHDAQGIMEPTVAATAMCALLLAIRLAERPALDSALLLGLALGAGLLTKESGRFAIAMVPVALLLFDWHEPRVGPRFARWAGGVALASAICVLCFSVLTLSPLWPVYQNDRSELRRPVGEALLHPIGEISHSLPQLLPGLIGYVGPVLLVAAFAGAATVARAQRRRMAVVALWGLLPFGGALLFANNGYVRYWLPAMVALLVPMAAGLLWLVRRARAQVRGLALRRLAATGAVAVALVPPGVLLVNVVAAPGSAHYPSMDDGQYVTSWASGNGWKAVARDLEARTGGRGAIIGVDRARPLATFLHHPERFRYTQRGTPATTQLGARFLIQNWSTPATSAERQAFRLVRRFPRPRGGQPILLFARR